MRNRITLPLLAGMLLPTFSLSAAVILGAPGDPGVGNCMPFGCSDAAVYQQLYSSTAFSSPITIAGLTFFLRNFDNTNPITGDPLVPNNIYPANYTITLAIVALPVNGLDTTVENNLVSPVFQQTFFTGFLSDFQTDHFTIQTTPANYFNYDPALGNLLVDIRNDGTDPSITMYLDVNSSAGGVFSSAYDSDPHPAGCPDGSAGLTTGCANSDFGLVTQFETPDDLGGAATPEPLTAALTVAGLFGLAVKRRLARSKR